MDRHGIRRRRLMLWQPVDVCGIGVSRETPIRWQICPSGLGWELQTRPILTQIIGWIGGNAVAISNC